MVIHVLSEIQINEKQVKKKIKKKKERKKKVNLIDFHSDYLFLDFLKIYVYFIFFS